MVDLVDYSGYTLQQLREAEAGIDQARFPETFGRLREELTRRGAVPAPLESKPIDSSNTTDIPGTARTALRLLWTSIWIGIANAVIHWSDLTSQAPAIFAALILLVTFTVLIWLTRKISLRRNWARITFLALTVLGSLFYVAQPALMFAGPALEVTLSVATAMLQFAALVFLFLRPSNRWFRSTVVNSGAV